ncbi:MAG: CDGSH iron-sulfur domain-containing protein [Planctomycetales bacterium]
MSEVHIRCRENGPLVVEGSVVVTDHEGKPFPISPDKPAVALCRCGVSGNRPFCDGSHRTADFQACETAPESD